MTDLFQGHGWRVALETAILPDGREKKVVRVHRCDAASVLAFKDPQTLLLIREYRPFWGEYVWMLPSGKIDKEHDLEEGAHRELREETGFAARSMRHYCSTNQGEGISITNHIFIAEDLYPDPLPQDEHELIKVHECTIDEAISRVLESPFVHTVSAYALLRYAREQHL